MSSCPKSTKFVSYPHLEILLSVHRWQEYLQNTLGKSAVWQEHTSAFSGDGTSLQTKLACQSSFSLLLFWYKKISCDPHSHRLGEQARGGVTQLQNPGVRHVPMHWIHAVFPRMLPMHRAHGLFLDSQKRLLVTQETPTLHAWGDFMLYFLWAAWNLD